MLLEFKLGNFRSFRGVETFTLVASKDTQSQDQLVQDIAGYRALRTALIYGPNSSGKSNFLEGIRLCRQLVLNSTDTDFRSRSLQGIEPFLLDTDSGFKPSYFEFSFIVKEKRYRYGFEYLGEEVISEWLYVEGKKREAMLFTRGKDPKQIKIGRNFTGVSRLRARTRRQSLFLTVAAQWNSALAIDIRSWFNNLRLADSPRIFHPFRLVERALQNESSREALSEALRFLDLGFEDIWLEETSSKEATEGPPSRVGSELSTVRPYRRRAMKTLHSKYDDAGNFLEKVELNAERQESTGSQKLIRLMSTILDAARVGGVLFVDEFDSSLHPLLTQALLESLSKARLNELQIVFVTHDVGLLNLKLLRNDQVWFVEKDKFGATHLTSLFEYKPRAAKKADYIEGRYGAIPFFGHAEAFLGALNGQAQAHSNEKNTARKK